MKRIARAASLAVLAAAMFAMPAPAQNDNPDSFIGPDYADAPEMTENPNVPHGEVKEFVMRSQDSKIYPGIVRIEGQLADRRDAYGNRIAAPAELLSKPAPYERHVWVYIPKQYVPGTAAPFMVVQDGHSYRVSEEGDPNKGVDLEIVMLDPEMVPADAASLGTLLLDNGCKAQFDWLASSLEQLDGPAQG